MPWFMAKYLDSLRAFADDLIAIQETLDFHMSARGRYYVLEPMGLAKFVRTLAGMRFSGAGFWYSISENAEVDRET